MQVEKIKKSGSLLGEEEVAITQLERREGQVLMTKGEANRAHPRD